MRRIRHACVMARQFYVYILFNQSRCLYVGMTNDM
jgi:predicted GIY-YIG superfamily endonuclease